MLMSIDDARAYMEVEGADRLAAVAEAVAEVRGKLPALGYRDAHAAWRDTGLDFDPTRLVIDAPQGGPALALALQALGVDVEMHDHRRVVFILTAMDAAERVLSLLSILKECPPQHEEIPALPMLTAIPPQAMEVRAAAMARSENVPLAACAGRIAAASAGLYPPGVPLVCPGEIIPAEVIDRLTNAKNQERFGVEGDTLLCVKQ
jgi:lysine decarboxylase